MDLQLEGKKALVTGSNRGTGEVIARTLAEEGVLVAVHSLEEGASSPVSAKIDNSVAVWGDITVEAGASQTVAQTLEKLGSVDILINNYGTATRGFWGTSQEADWIDVYKKNVLSAMYLIQKLTPQMKESQWGRVVQLGTIGSQQPNAIMPHYYASKGALANTTVSLALELKVSGVTVNTVSPGLIHTEELEQGYRKKAKKKGWGDSWESIVEKIVEHEFPNPVGRIATREEVADLVVFLCSPRAGYINGQNINVDGGAVRVV
ncbi:MAG: SDR family oxidoreductase [Pseudomonadales bacterium]|nr:SDR family oxidoreductase [Pseudomonadales bacterium]